MKDELDRALCAKYPKIFAGRYDGDIRQTLLPFGLEVGDGWYNIIDALCANIQGYVNHRRSERARALRYNRALRRALRGDGGGLQHYYGRGGGAMPWHSGMIERDIQEARYRDVPDAVRQVVAVQVKEKFGGLRFYVNGGDAVVHAYISMAESMSYRTCEVCGSPGERYTDGWHTVLCETHAQEQGRSKVYEEEENGDEAAV